jgi:gliding motility-associated-like protein
MRLNKHIASMYSIKTYTSFLLGVFVTFFTNFNLCKAQNTDAVQMKTGGNPKLSGIYSSKDPASIKQKSESVSNALLPSDFPVDGQHYTELIDKRTLTSRTFKDDNGQIIIKYGSKNLNYLDKENKLQPIYTKLNFYTNGWAATQQEFPTYLNRDGSTQLTLKEGCMKFNFNSKINNSTELYYINDEKRFNNAFKTNNSNVDYSDYTVGEDGMYVKNVIPNVDKKIVFNENRIETDYIIKQQITMGEEDLIISEEIQLPEGYIIKKDMDPKPYPGNEDRKIAPEGIDEYVVYSRNSIEEARFRTPIFYDAKKRRIAGKYNLIKQDNNYVLQIIVSGKWINNDERAYPIVIDPVVTGPTSNYPHVYMPSCQSPTYASDSIQIIIPPNITITSFLVTDSYFADETIPGVTMGCGSMYLTTSCGSTPHYTVGAPFGDTAGYAYLDHADLKSFLACCYPPSCDTQKFYVANHLARSAFLGPGCNTTYVCYSPVSPWPFSAYIVGHTVETTQGQWSVFPTPICSNICNVSLRVITNYGVPPYTITHPWGVASGVYGSWGAGPCTSTGSDTISLIIPGCPTTCGPTTLSVPPPVIKDVCGNTVAGLVPKNIPIHPVPVASASPESVCAGTPVNIAVSSCVTGSTFTWSGDDGSNGTGNISDNVVNPGTTPITVNYSVIPTANGCVGAPVSVQAFVNPTPIIKAGKNDTIPRGNSVQLNAIGGVSYAWVPGTGLSCTNCPNPIASPGQTTTYFLTGTDEYGCVNFDSLTVTVIQGEEELYIPNAFSPDGNNLNDQFMIYGTNIKTIDIQIFDRWGEQVYHGTDQYKGWDGKFHGNAVEMGVYVYRVQCEWMSGNKTTRNGIVTCLRKTDD